MAKTTVEIDETLMNEAIRITNLKTKKRTVIERGLRELIQGIPGTSYLIYCRKISFA